MSRPYFGFFLSVVENTEKKKRRQGEENLEKGERITQVGEVEKKKKEPRRER